MSPASVARLRQAVQAACGLLAAAALFTIMVLTLVDVSGRKLLSQSVPGSLELTELLMVAVIFAGLPLVSLQGEHVLFDSLDRFLPSAVRRAQAVLTDAVCGLTLAGMAWLLWQKAAQMAEYGDTTSQLSIGLAPFVQAMSALAALTALVHGLAMIWPVASHHPGLEEPS